MFPSSRDVWYQSVEDRPTSPILELDMQDEIDGEVESIYGSEDLLNNPYNLDGRR